MNFRPTRGGSSAHGGPAERCAGTEPATAELARGWDASTITLPLRRRSRRGRAPLLEHAIGGGSASGPNVRPGAPQGPWGAQAEIVRELVWHARCEGPLRAARTT